MRPWYPAAALAVAALATSVLAGPPPSPPAGRLPTGPPPYTPPTPDTVTRISIADLQKLMADKAVVIVDVRDPGAYGQGHIPGAINLPAYELGPRLKEVKDRTHKVVTYCACPEEITSGPAAAQFRNAGYDAAALLGGLNAWTQATGQLEIQLPKVTATPAP